MKYEYYNPSNEKGTCVTRCFSKLLNEDYFIVENKLNKLRKKLNCQNNNDIELFEEFFFLNNYEVINCDSKYVKDLNLSNGSYAIFCYKNDYYHLFPIIDNVIYDTKKPSKDLKIIKVYKKKEDYYAAYDLRYLFVHQKNMLWNSKKNTIDILKIMNEFKISKDSKILDLGCGEGRDAFYLLDKGYDVTCFDYSKNAINMCNKLSNNKYIDKFRVFDIMKDETLEKFSFIYSVSVLHMFVLDYHRDKFLKFIYEHLDDSGLSLIIVMGDGNTNYKSNINDAFKNQNRVLENELVIVPNTSCRIVPWDFFLEEIRKNKLVVVKKYISKDVPDFSECMCVLLKKDS